MRDVLEFAALGLTARHRHEYTRAAVYELDVMDDEAVVEGNRNVRPELSFAGDPTDADIGDVHAALSPYRYALLPRNSISTGEAAQAERPRRNNFV